MVFTILHSFHPSLHHRPPLQTECILPTAVSECTGKLAITAQVKPAEVGEADMNTL